MARRKIIQLLKLDPNTRSGAVRQDSFLALHDDGSIARLDLDFDARAGDTVRSYVTCLHGPKAGS